MATINPYLTFDGNCREAMTFYHQCLGGEFNIQTFGESPIDAPPGSEDRIMHASIVGNGITLMASDSMPGQPVSEGSNLSISIGCDDQAQQDSWFGALSQGGAITMEMQDTFWGARFGMLRDKFGIHWMFNLEKAHQAQ